MAYIGNTQNNQNYTPAVEYFNGDGSTTAFTLSRPVASVAQVQVVISNVPQNPGSAFTVSGSTITFTSAPPSGTANIYVYYTSPNTQVVQPGQGTVGATQVDGNYALWNKSGSDINYTAGNVGIGQTVPSTKLDVAGSISAGQTNGRFFAFGTSTFSAGGSTIPNYGISYSDTGGYYDLNVAGYTDVKFFTNQAERMRIDSAGRVTMPYQPAFHVKLNSTTNYSTVGTIPFTQVLVNIGSYYSTSTYRFTAPVDGTYAFSVKAFNELAGRSAININVNGVKRQGLYGPQEQGDMLNASLIITLAVNDYVTASLVSGTVFGDGSGSNFDAATFNGYLIG